MMTGRGLPIKDLIHSATPAREQRFVAMVSWLLKNDLIQEVHAYLFLLWPSPPPVRRSGSSDHDDLAVDWSPQELQSLATAVEGRPPEVANVLYRLVSYLREASAIGGGGFDHVDEGDEEEGGGGSGLDAYHRMTPSLLLSQRLDEVMTRLLVSRDDLLGVVAAFPGIVVMTHMSAA